MTRPFLLALLLSCFVAPYLGAPEPYNPTTFRDGGGPAQSGAIRDNGVTSPPVRLEAAAVSKAPFVRGGLDRPATPSGAPDDHSSAGFGATRQALRGVPHGVAGDTALTTGRPSWRPEVAAVGAPLAAVTRRLSGTATWCAPTPRYCKRWGGKAMLAAVPSFRYGDEPYTVQVTGFHGGKANAVLVTVVSYCACPRTAIDLSPHAFAQLAPLSVGRIRVVVDGVRGPAPRALPTAPTTDTDGG